MAQHEQKTHYLRLLSHRKRDEWNMTPVFQLFKELPDKMIFVLPKNINRKSEYVAAWWSLRTRKSGEVVAKEIENLKCSRQTTKGVRDYEHLEKKPASLPNYPHRP